MHSLIQILILYHLLVSLRFGLPGLVELRFRKVETRPLRGRKRSRKRSKRRRRRRRLQSFRIYVADDGM